MDSRELEQEIDAMYALQSRINAFKTPATLSLATSLDAIPFVKLMLITNPQTYGIRIQNYFKDRYNASDSTNFDSGDWGGCTEVKTSVVRNSLVHMVQIRPWQPIENYLFIVVDEQPKISITVMQIPAWEIHKIVKQSAHGSKNVVSSNKFNEFRHTFKVDDPALIRFKREYLHEFIQ